MVTTRRRLLKKSILGIAAIAVFILGSMISVPAFAGGSYSRHSTGAQWVMNASVESYAVDSGIVNGDFGSIGTGNAAYDIRRNDFPKQIVVNSSVSSKTTLFGVAYDTFAFSTGNDGSVTGGGHNSGYYGGVYQKVRKSSIIATVIVKSGAKTGSAIAAATGNRFEVSYNSGPHPSP